MHKEERCSERASAHRLHTLCTLRRRRLPVRRTAALLHCLRRMTTEAKHLTALRVHPQLTISNSLTLRLTVDVGRQTLLLPQQPDDVLARPRLQHQPLDAPGLREREKRRRPPSLASTHVRVSQVRKRRTSGAAATWYKPSGSNASTQTSS